MALGMDRRTCVDDARTQAAVERKFEIIGEALNRLRRTCPEIAFLHRAGLSTSATSHGYAIVRPERVWNYAENDLPAQGSAGATCRDGRAGGMSAERRLAPDVPAEESAARLYMAVPSGGRVCLFEFEAAEKRTERRAMAQAEVRGEAPMSRAAAGPNSTPKSAASRRSRSSTVDERRDPAPDCRKRRPARGGIGSLIDAPEGELRFARNPAAKAAAPGGDLLSSGRSACSSAPASSERTP